jgi:hypothetical protein
MVVVCMKLYNFIIESSESESSVPEPSGIDNGNYRDRAGMEIHLQDDNDTDEALHKRRRDIEQCKIRWDYTKRIEELGLARPSSM